jgi:hypothetical protein
VRPADLEIVAVPAFAFLFGSPLGALLAVVGAVSVPIIIHLLNRRRFKIVTWAAMRFLLAAEKKNSRRMRIEQLILLAVRCLIVLLIVLAMASIMPWAEAAWRGIFPDSVALVSGSGRRTHKVVVVDGSFSMAVKLGDKTAFDRARALAEEIVRESPRGDGFSIVLMSAPPRRIVPEPSEDGARVNREIRELRLPHGNADVAATLHTVENLLRQSPEKFEEREVYFLTDLQHSTWALKQPATVAAVLQKIQASARTIFVDVGQDGLDNTAVTRLALGEPLATAGMLMPITVTVHNYGSQARDHVRVGLWVGKARAQAADPPLEMRVAQEIEATINRGANTFSFPYKFLSPGDYVLQVRIDGDGLELDDSRAATVPVRSSVPVMLVDGKATPREIFDRGAAWLREALNPYESGPVPSNVPFRVKVVSDSQFADTGHGDLTDFDGVFFCDVPRLSPGEIRRLETHLRRGGGVVFALGEEVQFGAYNDLLYRNGQGLLPARLQGVQTAPRDVHFRFDVDSGPTLEPPLDAFRLDSDRLSLVSARFRKYVRTAPADKGGPRKVLSFVPASSVPGRTSPSVEGLPIRDPAILEWQPPVAPLPGDEAPAPRDRAGPAGRYRGRVVLVTTTVNTDWTSWPASPSFPALMQELARFAVAGRLREQSIGVGDPIEEFLPTSSTGLDAELTLPDGRTATVRTRPYEDINVLRWPDTDTSGIYRAVIGQHPQEHLFAVNVPATTLAEEASESDLKRLTREDLAKTYPEWEFQVVTDLGDVNHSGGPTAAAASVARPLGPGIAGWLLLGVLVLLLTEVVLAWRFGHYSGVAANEPPPAAGRWLPTAAAAVGGLALLVLGGVLLHDAWTGDFLGFVPESVRRGVEAALGIPPPAPGEGSHWRLEFSSYFIDAATDPWLAGGLLVAAAAGIFWIYRQEGRAGTLPRLLLGGLRLGLLLLLLAVLLPQLRLWFERQGWPDVVILIDDSYSMSKADRFQDDDVREMAQQLAREVNLTEPERLQLAQALVTRADRDWLTALLTQRKAKVHVYRCAAHAARICNVTQPEQIDEALRAVRDLRSEPKNDSSQLGGAVRQVLNDFRGSSLAAVVMLTDGVTTEGEDLAKVSRYATQMGVPLFFVGLGDAHDARDLALHDLQADDSVYVNDNLIFEVRLTGQGYAGRTVPVRLYEKGKERVLDEKQVTLDPNGKPVDVPPLIHKPDQEGETIYELRVPALEGEVTLENNVLQRTVHVRKAKLIKVLYVEGEARWEYRYLKTLLERESNRIEGNKSIDLKVWLIESEPDWATQDRSALAEFPAKAELNQFDVVIVGDVDPRPGPRAPRMTEHLQNLADFVKDRGGGLLMIAGEQFAPHAYKGTPLQDILPIDLLSDRQPPEPQGGLVEPYRPQLTPVGQLHPIFRFSPDERQNIEVWNGLKELLWWSEGYQPKRAAEVLATHPKVKRAGAAGGTVRAENAGLDGHPLVVQQFIGGGRSLFFGFNETWRWRYREHELRFNQFWIQTVRYLARSRTGRVELRLDKQTPYRRGEPIRITARFPDDAPPPPADTEVKVVVERRTRGANPADTEVQTVQLAKVEGSRSTFEGLLTRTPEGEYQFWLSAPVVTGTRPRAECRVLAPPGEMEVLRMNRPDMERAAEETQGRFYTLADADRVLAELPSGTRITLNASGPPMPLWNHLGMFALALGLLTFEWVIRKRLHLL